LDAELLLARALGHDSRARLVLDAATTVATDRRSRFEQMLARRERREPVAYILGARPFRGISLLVDRRVLIPRPETELLVELALDLPPGISVADVGTGSGAVALALQTERPDLLVTGIDRSRDAIAVARRNAEVLRLSEVRFVRADLLDGGRYDAVLANLPYVRPGEELAPEIVSYEPPEAVYGGGEDGLDAIRRLVSVLGNGPRVRFVALEVGIGQAASVADLVSGAGFGTVVVHRDLAGHQRVVAGRR
jgi:release factor glutamine methyltransferase